MDSNLINIIKQVDLFKRPYMMRSERSIAGKAWDIKGGSFFGTFVTLFIFSGLASYSTQIIKNWDDGLLDIFTEQEQNNPMEDSYTNDVALDQFRFLQQIEAMLLKDDPENLQKFFNHPASEVFEKQAEGDPR